VTSSTVACAVYLLSALVFACVGTVVWRRRAQASRAARSLLVVTAGGLWWCLADVVAVADPVTVVGAVASLALLPGLAVTVAAVLCLAFCVVDPFWRPTRGWLLALSAHPVLVALAAATNPLLHLVFSADGHGRVLGPQGVRAWVPGPAFWAHTCASYAVLAVSLVLLAWAAWTAPAPFRAARAAVWGAVCVPVALNVVTLGGLMGDVLDPTPAGFAMAAVLLVPSVLRQDLFSLVPVARERIVDQIEDPIIALSLDSRLVDANPAGERLVRALLPQLPPELLGARVTLPPWPAPGAAGADAWAGAGQRSIVAGRSGLVGAASAARMAAEAPGRGAAADVTVAGRGRGAGAAGAAMLAGRPAPADGRAATARTAVAVPDVTTAALVTGTSDLRLLLDGRQTDLHLRTSPLVDRHGRSVGAVVVGRDVTAAHEQRRSLAAVNDQLREQVRTIERLRADLVDLAMRDPLTGLHNRRHLMMGLDGLVASRLPFALLMIDVDGFKRLNDTWGHLAGDDVLVEIARRLSAGMPDDGTIARWGGEEFVVVLPGLDGVGGGAVAEALRARCAHVPLEHEDGRTLRWTVSIGVAASPEHGAAERDLLRAADAALYAAKRAGRNRVRVHGGA